MNVKVKTVKPMLRPMGHDEALQRIAIVYIDHEEYRVLAPAKAEGPAIEWLGHAFVRQPDRSTFGGELEVADRDLAGFVIARVREQLRKIPAEPAPRAEVQVASASRCQWRCQARGIPIECPPLQQGAI